MIQLLLLLAIVSPMAEAAQKQLIIISAPSIHNSYYKSKFLDIIRFDIAFARAIASNDFVLVIADKDTLPYLNGSQPSVQDSLPRQYLIEGRVDDVWIRDFSFVLTPNGAQKFRYRPSYLKASEAQQIQNSFFSFLQSKNVNQALVQQSNLILDGGNVVFDYAGRAVITKRLLKDNSNFAAAQIVDQMKTATKFDNIAFVEDLGDATGHSDGMVSFVDDGVLLVGQLDEPDRSTIANQLQAAFGNSARVVEIPTFYVEEKWRDFESACGLFVNSLVTRNAVYVPTFGNDPVNQRLGYSVEGDQRALDLIARNTKKTVVSIRVPHSICEMGGSVRCLTMQLEGSIASSLLTAAAQT